ncbi:MAG: MFS transporter [Chloroflexota bacterium]
MSELKGLRGFLHQWGGGRAAFFAYTHLSHDLTTGLMVALLALVRDDLGLNYLQSGLLVSVYTIVSGVAQFPMGWLGDRAKRNVVAAIGLGGVSLAAVGAALSPSYYPILAFMVVMGIFGGAYHPSATSLLSSYFEPGRRGSAIGMHLLGGSIGFTVGPLLGGLLASWLGWRPAFILLTLPALVAVPLVLRWFRPRAEAGAAEAVSPAPAPAGGTGPPVKEKLPGIAQVLRPVAFVTVLAVLTQLVGGSSIAFIPLFLVDKHGIDPANAAMLLAVVRGGGMAGSLLGGWLSDKRGRKLAVLTPIVAVGPLLYLITHLSFGVCLIVSFAVFGIAMSTRQSSIQALLMDASPPRLRSTIFGIYFGLSQEGQSLMQPVAGSLMDLLGIVLVMGYIAFASLALSGVAIFGLLRPGRGRRPAGP